MKKIMCFLFFVLILNAETLYFGFKGEPLTLDPASQWEDASSQVVANIYDTLVKVDPETLKIQPSLAERWECSEDGKTWIFTLRKGIKFSNGQPLTSGDVVFSFRRLLKKEAGGFLFYFLKDVKSLGLYRVMFVLKKRFSPFLHVLTVTQASIVYGKEGKFKPIGTGPYFVKLWEKGKRMILVKNPYYRGKMGNIDRVILIFNLSMDSIYSLLMEGKLDITNGISISRVEALKNSDKFHLYSFPVLSLEYLVFNPSDRWAARASVRKALSYLWNPRWIFLAFGQFRNPVCRIITLGDRDCLWKYAPAKASRIIRSSGLQGKARLTLLYPEDPLYTKIFVPFAHEAKKRGINIKLLPVGNSQKLDRMFARRDYSIALYSWIWDYPEPYNMLSFLLPGAKMLPSYPTLSSFPQADLLRKTLSRALSIPSEEERMKIYTSIERAIYKDHLLIPIAQLKTSFFASNRLKGISADSTGILRFRDIYKK